MSENKRLITVFAVIIIVVGIILLIAFWPEKDGRFACDIKADGDYKNLGVVNYDQYKCLQKNESKNGLVVADKLSKKDKKSLNDTATKLGHVLYYVDTKNLSSEELKTVKKDLKYKDEKSFDKNVILVLENGKVDTYKEGDLTNTDDLYNFLKEANLTKFACDVQASDDYENLGDVTYDQYKCLLESGTPFVLVIEQTTCGYCHKYNPVINEYVGEQNLPIYTIQMDKLSDNDLTALKSSLSYFEENTGWGTPLTLGIKDKKVVIDIGGFTDDTNDIEEVYKELGLK